MTIIPLKKPSNEKDAPDMFLISNIDETTALLDDKINEIQTMKNSSDVTPKLRQMCDSLEFQLQEFNKVIEEWVKFQKMWRELEPIFRSPDISRQLPNEAKDFDRQNKTYKQFMKEANDDRKCSTFISATSEHLATFRTGNLIMDGIQKKMNQYLDTKRKAFPRFYFLSNENLIEILADTKDPTKVNKHMNKCFEAIEDVVFTETEIITKFISPENETQDFIETIDPHGDEREGCVEIWMCDIERSMRKSMKSLMAQTYSNFFENDRIAWIQKWPAMCVLGIDMSLWTSRGEEWIGKIPQEPKALKLFEGELMKEISEVVVFVRGKLSKLQRVKVGALIVLDVHSKETVKNL